jgi:hypothetical protein
VLDRPLAYGAGVETAGRVPVAGSGSLTAAAGRLEGFARERRRVGDDPASPDRVHFTAVVEGRPMRAVVSGWPYDRVD